jgi:hypothetical protein
MLADWVPSATGIRVGQLALLDVTKMAAGSCKQLVLVYCKCPLWDFEYLKPTIGGGSWLHVASTLTVFIQIITIGVIHLLDHLLFTFLIS